MHHLALDVGLLERVGKPHLRPTMQITYQGARISEEVNIHYSFSGGSAARDGKARYIRAWVHNLFGFPARNCQVFVDSISLNRTIIESERSPLHRHQTWLQERALHRYLRDRFG